MKATDIPVTDIEFRLGLDSHKTKVLNDFFLELGIKNVSVWQLRCLNSLVGVRQDGNLKYTADSRFSSEICKTLDQLHVSAIQEDFEKSVFPKTSKSVRLTYNIDEHQEETTFESTDTHLYAASVRWYKRGVFKVTLHERPFEGEWVLKREDFFGDSYDARSESRRWVNDASTAPKKEDDKQEEAGKAT